MTECKCDLSPEQELTFSFEVRPEHNKLLAEALDGKGKPGALRDAGMRYGVTSKCLQCGAKSVLVPMHASPVVAPSSEQAEWLPPWARA